MKRLYLHPEISRPLQESQYAKLTASGDDSHLPSARKTRRKEVQEMLKRLSECSIAVFLLCLAVTIAAAQQQWKVGDKVEIKNLSMEWVPGTIIGTDDWNGTLVYRVKLDDERAPNAYFNHTLPADIRPRAGQAAAGVNPGAAGGMGNLPAGEGGSLKVGDLVDAYFNPREGDRGIITEVGDRRYKVRFRGCEPQFQNWFEGGQVHTPASISAAAPEVTYLIGKWRTTTAAVGGNYMVWGQSPGIEIKADGTYVWYEYAGRPPTKGTWTADAKVPNATMGTQKFDGVLVKDATGIVWKVFKWKVEDPQDHIEIDRLFSGLSDVGVRVR
jgi:hypothetical protein